MHYYKSNKYYFKNKFDTNNIDKQDKNTIIIYRNYSEKKIDKLLILKIKNYCKKKKIKFYLSNNIKLAISLNLDGAYIPSFNKDFNHLSFSYKKNFKIIGSAHNIFELNIKKTQRINEIFISPIFKKKNIQPYGIHKARHLFNSLKFSKIALGGINKQNVKLLRLGIFNGFAGIKYFE